MNAVKRLGPAAMAAVLACGLVTARPALADKGGNKKPPQPPEPLAGWEVTILPPSTEGYDQSIALGVSGGQQAGYAVTNDGYDHAGLWTGTAESWVDLHPAGALSSGASGIGGGQQVGVAYVFDKDRGDWFEHAGFWTGTAESWVDLHPAQFGIFEISRAYATDGGRQVGEAGWWLHQTVASLWSGTAESWVDLHPYDFYDPGDPPWDWSCAFGVCGNQVVGHIIGSGEHAMLWTVEPYSWVDLHPPKARFASTSVAYDVSDGQQVGGVVFYKHYGTHLRHASLWSGTAGSWVDLHPDDGVFPYYESVALGVSHGFQAGYATTDIRAPGYWTSGGRHAGIWSGTAKSWVDLHTLLPAEYLISSAQDIEVTDADIWVVGSAEYDDANFFKRSHAVLWHKRLSE
jgi:hypothetical protein